MKIIFLDIDGVLNSLSYDRRRDWTVQSYIDKSRLPLLKKLIDETGAKIVLSSSWREHWGKSEKECDEDGEYIKASLAQFGLSVYDKTPDLGLGRDRADEIRKWLTEHADAVESFVILDDRRYAWGDMSENFVKTNLHRMGLEEEHVRQAIEILMSK